MKKFGLVLLSVLSISGCGKTNTEIVKDSYPYFSDTIAVGGALEHRSLCSNVEWSEFETQKGQKIVEYKCYLNGANQYLQYIHDLQLELMRENQFKSRYRDIEREYKWELNAPKNIPKKIVKWQQERENYEIKVAQLEDNMKFLDSSSLTYQFKLEDRNSYQKYIDDLSIKIDTQTELLNNFDEQAIISNYQAEIAKADKALANIITKKFGQYDFVNAYERFQWGIDKDRNAVLVYAAIDFVNVNGQVFTRPMTPEDALIDAYEDRINHIRHSIYVKTYLASLGYQDSLH